MSLCWVRLSVRPILRDNGGLIALMCDGNEVLGWDDYRSE